MEVLSYRHGSDFQARNNFSRIASSDHGISSDQAFDNLFPALVECFVIIFAGYFAGRAGLMSSHHGRGLAVFVSKFAMPALLFRSMCLLHFDRVNWYFLASIFAAKTIVFGLVLVFTLLLVRPTHIGKMGIYGIFATQSHDFALGIPIVRALYSTSHPEYEQYLYLIAPISVAILNPIGFTFMEAYRWQHTSPADRRSWWHALLHVLLGVVSNPIVFMTVLGLIGNVVFHQSVPGVLDQILKVLGDAFAATALFCLGHSMVGRIKSSEKGIIFTTSLLIAAKMLLSPFLIRELVTYLDRQMNKTELVDMSTYGFLYGTFPTAPSVFIYASQYSMQANMMATGMVVSTFLSAPLMFVSARMITLPITDSSAYESLITKTAFDISIISIICAFWVVLILIIHRRFQSVPHRFTICLLVSQVLSCIGMILWVVIDQNVAWYSYVQFSLFFIGVMGTRCWMALLATAIFLLRTRSLCSVLKIRGYLCIYGFGLPVLLCGIVFMTGVVNKSHDTDPSFMYGFSQRIVATIGITINIIITITMLVLAHRHHASQENCDPRNCVTNVNCIPPDFPTTPIDIVTSDVATMTSSSLANSRPRFGNIPALQQPSPLTAPQDEPLVPTGPAPDGNDTGEEGKGKVSGQKKSKKVIKGRPRKRTTSSRSNQGCSDCTGFGCGQGPGVLSIEDIVPDVRSRSRQVTPRSASDTRTSEIEDDEQKEEEEEQGTGDEECLVQLPAGQGVRLVDSGCSPRQIEECAGLLQQYQVAVASCPGEGDEGLVLAERDQHQLTRHITLVLFLLASAFIGLALSIWKLLQEAPSGVYVEIEFLDVVLNFGQAIFTFALFGLDYEMVLEPLLRRLAFCLNWCCPLTSPRWRRFLYRLNHVKIPHPEDLNEETKQTCDKFIRHHLQSCQNDIVGEKQYGWRTYQVVFSGRDLVDWLLEMGLTTDREEAVIYGRQLVSGGVIEHILTKHHFQDAAYLYRITQEAQNRAFQSQDVV